VLSPEDKAPPEAVTLSGPPVALQNSLQLL
jgi:hypothetical protein